MSCEIKPTFQVVDERSVVVLVAVLCCRFAKLGLRCFPARSRSTPRSYIGPGQRSVTISRVKPVRMFFVMSCQAGSSLVSCVFANDPKEYLVAGTAYVTEEVRISCT